VENIEPTLRQLIADYDLPFTRVVPKGQVFWQHSNGHKIWLGGMNNPQVADRKRGRKWRRFIIDEAGEFDNLGYIVHDIIEPALSDYDGDLILAGTPGKIEEGYWWEITTGKGTERPWLTKDWNCTQNPHHPAYYDPIGFLQAEREKHGWREDNATYKREWLGKWAVDLESLIYPYRADRNGYEDLPEWHGKWFRTLGVDVGNRDKTTFTVTASRQGFPEVWIEESYGGHKRQEEDVRRVLGPNEIVSEIEKLCIKYGRIDRILIDPSAGGLSLIHMLQKRGLPAEGARKVDKNAGIRLVQELLRTARLQVHTTRARELISEWAKLLWDDKHHDHRGGMEDDCADGAIYAIRGQDRQYGGFNPVQPVAPPTAQQALEAELRAHRDRVAFEVRIKNRRDLNDLQKRRLLRAGR
jgi:hypothetical protein